MVVRSLTTAETTTRPSPTLEGYVCDEKKPLNKPFKTLSDPRDAVPVVLTKSPEEERESGDWRNSVPL